MNLGWFDTYTADCALKNSACANCTRFDLLYMSVECYELILLVAIYCAMFIT